MTGCADSEEFRKRLLNEAGVAVLADIHFGRRVPGRRPAHPLLVRGVAGGDRERRIARIDAFVRRQHEVQRRCRRRSHDNRRVARRRARRASRTRARQDGDRDGRARPTPRPTSRRTRKVRGRRCPRDLVDALHAARDRHGEHRRAHRRPPRRFRRRSRATSTRSCCRRRIAAQKSRAGVCWPEFADLDWAARGSRDRGAARRRAAIASASPACFCAIAETGTLVVLTGADTPTATTLLPDTHVAVVRADRIVSGMEEAFALVRARARRAAARGQPHLGAVAHRRHRADDRARRARAVPRAHPRAGLDVTGR